MILDFAALPPEVNSARMYAGAGPGPMLAAAASWDALAAQLDSFAGGYSSALTSVHGQAWSGPASNAMAAAATPYATWAAGTAVQAQQAASQARMAVAAYEAAFAMTVPPSVVAANRSLLAALVATNFFGQNTPAIAATEVAYAEMWAQDAAAMYGYAASSLPAAAALTPFKTPPQTANSAAASTQHAAVAHAAAQTAQHLAQTASSATHQVHSATAASTSNPSGTPASNGMLYIHDWKSFEQIFKPFWGWSNQFANTGVTIGDDGDAAGYTALMPRKAFLPEPALGLLGGKDPFLTAEVQPASVAAGAGRAASVGQLSVPRSWTTLAKTGPVTPGSQPQSAVVDQRAVAAQLAESVEPASGEMAPPVSPLRGSSPHYAGNQVYRMRDDRNFRMPRYAVGG